MSESDKKPLKGRPKKMSAERVRDVAMTAYWQEDPADVSVNSICKLAGVSKPSLYNEFGSEDGLTLAVLDSYAERVLADVFAILNENMGFSETLEALTNFASADPRMETGCLFHKMRAGKHRLGPKTRAKIDEIDAAAQIGYREFLRARIDAGDWSGSLSLEDGARYLAAQMALAVTQRGAGEDAQDVRPTLTLALSVFQPSDIGAQT